MELRKLEFAIPDGKAPNADIIELRDALDRVQSALEKSDLKVKFNGFRIGDSSDNGICRVLVRDGSAEETDFPSDIRFRAGDRLLICTESFFREISLLEMQVDLLKSHTCEEWTLTMLRRIMMKLGHDKMTAMTVIAAECRE